MGNDIKRNKPRKNVEQLRTIEMSFRLRPDEHAELAELAARSGLSIADYVRRMTVGRDAMRFLPAKEEIVKICMNLHKLGTNINTIAKHLNTSAKINGAATSADIDVCTAPLEQQIPYVSREIERAKNMLRRL